MSTPGQASARQERRVSMLRAPLLAKEGPVSTHFFSFVCKEMPSINALGPPDAFGRPGREGRAAAIYSRRKQGPSRASPASCTVCPEQMCVCGTRAMARWYSGDGKVSRICGQGQPSLPAPGRLPSGKKKCALQRTLLCCGIMDVIRLGVSFSAPGLFSGKKAGKGSLTLRWRAARPDNGRPGPSWSPARRCRRYSSGPGAVQTARSWRAGLPRC